MYCRYKKAAIKKRTSLIEKKFKGTGGGGASSKDCKDKCMRQEKKTDAPKAHTTSNSAPQTPVYCKGFDDIASKESDSE